ncbi:hypothetical protein CR513_63079, partial [Mucuna pruriens]
MTRTPKRKILDGTCINSLTPKHNMLHPPLPAPSLPSANFSPKQLKKFGGWLIEFLDTLKGLYTMVFFSQHHHTKSLGRTTPQELAIVAREIQLIFWCSKKQPPVASPCLLSCICIFQLKLQELCDNLRTISLSHNPVLHSRTKFVFELVIIIFKNNPIQTCSKH